MDDIHDRTACGPCRKRIKPLFLSEQTIFPTSYHSWERGLCEHTNGLVRQYFAKGTDFREVWGDEVRRVEGLLNGRPRKVLEYRTPEEVFKEALALGG